MACAWRAHFLDAHLPYISSEHYSLSLTQQTPLLFLGNAEAENRYSGFFVHFHHHFFTYVGSCRLKVYSFLLSLLTLICTRVVEFCRDDLPVARYRVQSRGLYPH